MNLFEYAAFINKSSLLLILMLSIQTTNSKIHYCTPSSCDIEKCCSGVTKATCCPWKLVEDATKETATTDTLEADSNFKYLLISIAVCVLVVFISIFKVHVNQVAEKVEQERDETDIRVMSEVEQEKDETEIRVMSDNAVENELPQVIQEPEGEHERDETEIPVVPDNAVENELPQVIQEPEGEHERDETEIPVVPEFPTDWVNIPVGTGYNKRLLQSGTEEFDLVSELFNKSGQSFSIIRKIEKIQNPMIFKQFENRKAHVMEKYNGQVVSQYLFHGTKRRHVENICSSGFVVNFAGDNGHKYGKGVYFAKNSSYSMHYTDDGGKKSMFLAEVITGTYARGQQDLRVEPRDGNFRYDSVVDNMNDPKIFVVFREACSYPTYLITFTARRSAQSKKTSGIRLLSNR